MSIDSDSDSDPTTNLDVVSPSVQTYSDGSLINYEHLKEVAARLRGDGASRRYPAAVVKPVLNQQATSIAYQAYMGSEAGQQLTCYRLEDCPTHTVLEITVDGAEGEKTAYALPTMLEASYFLVDRLAGGLATETPLDVTSVDESVIELLSDTAPSEVEPTINHIFDTIQ